MRVADLPTELRDRAKSRALNSALLAGEASGLEEAADLLQGTLATNDRNPTPNLPKTDAAAGPAPEPDPEEQTVRRETMVPAYNLMRTHGDWISVAAIETGLAAQGHPVNHRTLLRVLNNSVRTGLLERRGDLYRIAPLDEVATT